MRVSGPFCAFFAYLGVVVEIPSFSRSQERTDRKRNKMGGSRAYQKVRTFMRKPSKH